MAVVFLILAAYFFGAIPFGFLIAKAHGIDIRKVGSGNIGATNVSRALGKKWGYFCFLLDVLKGMLPMIAALLILPQPPTTGHLSLWLCVGVAAILGHVFPVYLKFQGGKGVATSLGVVLGLWPYYTLIGIAAFAIWAIVVLKTRYISLGSIVAAVLFPVLLTIATILVPQWEFARIWPLFIAALVLPILVVIRHKDNIRRILNKTESKIGATKK
jgi:acyl phosphate:glycerol-3-phosphate acyltransferase